jgi:hypothetical protein
MSDETRSDATNGESAGPPEGSRYRTRSVARSKPEKKTSATPLAGPPNRWRTPGAGSGLGRAATDEKSAAGLFLVGEGLAVGADLDFGLFAGGEDLGLVGYDGAMLCD